MDLRNICTKEASKVFATLLEYYLHQAELLVVI
jgi:hypothetical protein